MCINTLGSNPLRSHHFFSCVPRSLNIKVAFINKAHPQLLATTRDYIHGSHHLTIQLLSSTLNCTYLIFHIFLENITIRDPIPILTTIIFNRSLNYFHLSPSLYNSIMSLFLSNNQLLYIYSQDFIFLKIMHSYPA